MKSFDEYKNELKPKIFYKSDNFEFIEYNDWQFFNNKNDIVYIVPYLVEQKSLYIIEQTIPSYNYDLKLINKKYANFISGIVKEGEKIDNVIIRKLKDTCGLALINTKSFEYWGPLNVFPDTSVKCYFSIIPLYNTEFTLGSRKMDNKRDLGTNLIKISLEDLLKIKFSDVLSNYLLIEFKNYLNK